jgi:UDP-N-acetylmuramate dehydrogenase
MTEDGTATRELAAELRRRLQGRVSTDVSLAPFTTYRLGGPAAILVEPAGGDDLLELSRALAASDPIGDQANDGSEAVPILFLGRGSNLVVSDHGFRGVVVHTGARFSGIEPATGRATGIVAGAGTPLPMVANWAARRGLSGLEFLIAIPGSVGGAVRMNAGAHGGEIADFLTTATIFDLRSGRVDERPSTALGHSYRRSSLEDADLVLEAGFELKPDDTQEIRARMDSYRRHRAQTQPGAVQNAGSVFKNPRGESAGRLVDAAGLKGFSVGEARVSELHANFFIAGDGATAQNVYDLVREVRARVGARFGIELEPEIRFVGRFENVAVGAGEKTE